MPITPKMQDALNAQANAELASAYTYLAMAAHCDASNWKGASHWLRIQHEEETGHGLKLIDHVVQRGGRAALGALEAPRADFGTLTRVFEDVVKQERAVSERIDRLYELASAEKDYAAVALAQWFVTEQVEEEASAASVLAKLKACEDRPGSMFYIDKELGKRSRAASGGN